MNIKSLRNIAIVSTFPPTKCGIGIYASQMFDFFIQQNIAVKKISVRAQLGVDKALNLCGTWYFLKLIPTVISNEKIIINYHKSFFFT
jgi:hypothetical protein